MKQVLRSKDSDVRQSYTRNKNGSYHFEEKDKDGFLRIEYDVWGRINISNKTVGLSYDNIKIYQNSLTGQRSFDREKPLFEINRAGLKPAEKIDPGTLNGTYVKTSTYRFSRFTGLDGVTREDVNVKIPVVAEYDWESRDWKELDPLDPIAYYENEKDTREKIRMTYALPSSNGGDGHCVVQMDVGQKESQEPKKWSPIARIDSNVKDKVSHLQCCYNEKTYTYNEDGSVTVQEGWPNYNPFFAQFTPFGSFAEQPKQYQNPPRQEKVETAAPMQTRTKKVSGPKEQPPKSILKKKQESSLKGTGTKVHNEGRSIKFDDVVQLRAKGMCNDVTVDGFFDVQKENAVIKKALPTKRKYTLAEVKQTMSQIPGFKSFEKPKLELMPELKP